MSGQRQRRFGGRFSTTSLLVVGLLLIALAARVGAILVWGDGLADDRDGYLGIARNVAAGAGYCRAGTENPTAFRPPLYPIVLSSLFQFGLGTAAIGVLHVLLGTVTVFLAFLLGKRLGLERGAIAAAGLVAVDPMLLRYTAYSMTETLFTFLVTLLLVLICRPPETQNIAASRGHDGMRAAFVGIVFGLCALCRPTIWAFGGLVAVVWFWNQFRAFRSDRSQMGRRFACAGIVVANIVMIVAPWTLRNMEAVGHPVFTTTHGGYTLLLGNNPAFYRDVVDQPWGTVWTKGALEKWQQSIEKEMSPAPLNVPVPADGPPPSPMLAAPVPLVFPTPIEGEVDRDRWMYDRALDNINSEPAMFLRACWLRFRRFWNVVPLNASGQGGSRFVNWCVGLFYSAILFGVAVSLCRMRHSPRSGWVTLLLLMAAFTFVHLFYWSNARMRAPLIPAIAVIAVAGFERRRARSTDGPITPIQEAELK